MFSRKDGVTRAQMDKMVVLSLHTDGEGPRREEFAALRDRLTQSATIPGYVVVDPFEDLKVLYKTDYNTAIKDKVFGEKLARAARRFHRSMRRRQPVVDKKT